MSVSKKREPAAGATTASAVRAEAAESTAARPPAKAHRRRFTAEYKRRIIAEADAAQLSGIPGAVGELLRREGLFSSNLSDWRRRMDAGELAALQQRKNGPAGQNPLAATVARLEREKAKLEERLRKAEIVIDVQKKVGALLGAPMSTSDDDEPSS